MLRRLERALEMFIALLLGCMSVVVFFNVVARYVFDKAFPWTEEISLFMFTWVIFLGALIAFSRHRHLGVDLIINVLPKFGQKVAFLIAGLGTGLALCVMLWGGIKFYFQTAGWPAPATQIPYGYINAVMPFSAFCMLLLLIRDLYRFFRSGKPQGQGGSEC